MKQYFYMTIKENRDLVKQFVQETTGEYVKVTPREKGIEIDVGGYSTIKQYPHFFDLLIRAGKTRQLADFKESFADYFMSKVLKDLRKDEKIICLNTCHKLALNSFYTDCLKIGGRRLIDSLMASKEMEDTE